MLRALTPTEVLRLDRDFAALAHAHQLPPLAGNDGAPWRTWLLLGGRGAGKTRTGAEFVRALVHGHAPYADAPHGAIALIGETAHDVREVMIEGPSGILRSSPRSERPQWTGMRKRLEWPNGAVAYAFSAEDPEQLRGPQFDAAWCDELAKWHYADETFDMLQFGLRLGAFPRQIVTTTPRPTALVKRLIDDPRTAVSAAVPPRSCGATTSSSSSTWPARSRAALIVAPPSHRIDRAPRARRSAMTAAGSRSSITTTCRPLSRVKLTGGSEAAEVRANAPLVEMTDIASRAARNERKRCWSIIILGRAPGVNVSELGARDRTTRSRRGVLKDGQINVGSRERPFAPACPHAGRRATSDHDHR